MQYEFVAKKIGKSKPVTWVQYVQDEQNVLQEGKTYLDMHFGDSDDYKILSSQRLVFQCLGCQEEQPNQLAHMDCPGGCLHDPEECGCI